MHARDAILTIYHFNERLIDAYLGDLDDADLLVRPVEGQNHIAWQLGHLISVEHALLDAVRPGSSPALPEGFAAAHGRDEASTTSDDPSRFRSKAEYLALWKAQRAASKSVLSALTDAEMDAPGPERTKQLVSNVGGVFVLLGTHAQMHLGQFVGVRRKLGKPRTI